MFYMLYYLNICKNLRNLLTLRVQLVVMVPKTVFKCCNWFRYCVLFEIIDVKLIAAVET